MKATRVICVALAASLALVLAACNAGTSKTVPASQPSPVEFAREKTAKPTSVADGQSQEAASVDPADILATGSEVAPSKYSYTADEVDYDLSVMSGTAVYSAVYQIVTNPNDYQDSVIKIRGIYYSQYDDSTKRRYFFVIVPDATACCAQGIEFVWDDGEHVYPDDFPEEGSEVIVTGTFGSYAERSSLFAYLKESSFELAV